MLSQRQRPVVWALAGIAGIWIIATAGYMIARNAKVTAEKVQAYVAAVDLSKLSTADRADALNKLAAMLNALSLEDRRRLRLGGTAEGWFTQMTEEEKAAFIEATMPTGFKQMIAAFEEQPEEKRRRTIDESLKRLREANAQAQAGAATGGKGGTNRGAALSPELEAKVRTIGLKSFYSQSSAQTKAELAPLLEEMQKAMESGRMMRGR
jgi:hypothetical protein